MRAVVAGGYRSLVRRAPWTPAVTVAAGDHSLSSEEGMQRASLEKEDWVFAEEEVESVCEVALNPTPRVVFEAAPSLEEAKDATLDLKDAFERMYECKEEQPQDENCILPSVLMPSPENRAVSAMPKRVFDAFTLLQQSPEAQIVVASLASDPNIWNALLKNDRLMNFYESRQIDFSPISTVESIAENEEIYSEASSVTLFLNKASSVTLKDRLRKMVEYVKMEISNISIKISDFFQDLKGTFTTEGSNEESDAKTLIGSSFMAIVIAVIFLILFKRIR
ncbi:hypothetical protein J5N97_027202 [Dioscorea zingiberensis]|uniref:Uncharacterized protein n=1 Tax=Dioscorea zingiberensis TaxID=325984 RepID=A0A9D5H7E4_9LILI|nr:hypothetical protein J5N97_027202 [Dioscorea zingiberensis]